MNQDFKNLTFKLGISLQTRSKICSHVLSTGVVLNSPGSCVPPKTTSSVL